jgi:hypothetical protein
MLQAGTTQPSDLFELAGTHLLALCFVSLCQGHPPRGTPMPTGCALYVIFCQVGQKAPAGNSGLLAMSSGA